MSTQAATLDTRSDPFAHLLGHGRGGGVQRSNSLLARPGADSMRELLRGALGTPTMPEDWPEAQVEDTWRYLILVIERFEDAPPRLRIGAGADQRANAVLSLDMLPAPVRWVVDLQAPEAACVHRVVRDDERCLNFDCGEPARALASVLASAAALTPAP